MPLSPDEQRILDEIEQRLAEEDPRLVEAVSRTSLYTHLARRIKWSLLAFARRVPDADGVPDVRPRPAVGRGDGVRRHARVGAVDLPVPQAADPGSDARDAAAVGRFSLTGLLARLAGRFRTPPPTPPSS